MRKNYAKGLASEGYYKTRWALAEQGISAAIMEELWRHKILLLAGPYTDALRTVHLDTGSIFANRTGNNIIELNRNHWRYVVIGVRIVGIGPAAGGSGQKEHEAKNNTTQRSMRKQEHLFPNLSNL